MTEPIYPDITIPLSEEDGNIFSIIGRARVIARRAGVASEEIEEFSHEINNTPTYSDALKVVEKWFSTT